MFVESAADMNYHTSETLWLKIRSGVYSGYWVFFENEASIPPLPRTFGSWKILNCVPNRIFSHSPFPIQESMSSRLLLVVNWIESCILIPRFQEVHEVLKNLRFGAERFARGKRNRIRLYQLFYFIVPIVFQEGTGRWSEGDSSLLLVECGFHGNERIHS